MAGVVHPRGELVDQQPAVLELEHLHAEHADVVEPGRGRRAAIRSASASGLSTAGRRRWCGAGCRPRGGSRPADRWRSSPSRPRAAITDTSRPKSAAPRGWPARRRCASKAASAPAACLDPDLALAVVAVAAGLQQRRQAERVAACRQARAVSTAAKATVGDAGGVEKGLLVHAVLGDGQRAARRARPSAPAASAPRPSGRHVLELEGDHVGRPRPAASAPSRRRSPRRYLGGDAGGRRSRGSGSRTATSKPSRPAARAIIRPSWPPPSTPMVAPGESGNVATRD